MHDVTAKKAALEAIAPHQLFHRDIPTLRGALRLPVTVALLKGAPIMSASITWSASLTTAAS